MSETAASCVGLLLFHGITLCTGESDVPWCMRVRLLKILLFLLRYEPIQEIVNGDTCLREREHGNGDLARVYP